MAYPQEISVGALVPTSTAFGTAEVLTAAAAVYGAYCAHYPVIVKRLSFHVSTAISDLTASVVRLTKVTQGNVTSVLGGSTMTISNGLAARKVVYKDCTPTEIGVGDLLQFEHLTQGGLGGTPAGAGYYGFLAELSPEFMTNETNASVG
jgi:hypothetical protein